MPKEWGHNDDPNEALCNKCHEKGELPSEDGTILINDGGERRIVGNKREDIEKAMKLNSLYNPYNISSEEDVVVKVFLKTENADKVLSVITSALEYEGIEYTEIKVVPEEGE